MIGIEFLYWEDCPSHERALELLHQVLDEEDVQARIQVMQVETEEEAERVAFPGSPTIRIEGRDIEEHAGPVGLTCRAYRQPNGRISPLPPRDRIVRAVRAAQGSNGAPV